MTPPERFFEPFVYLVDVTDTSALVSWGGFFLARTDDGWGVVDDDDLPDGPRRRGGTIGVQSAPYGRAVVELLDTGGTVVCSAEVTDRNHAWLEGLEPDTEYRYRIRVDGEPWAEGERRDWAVAREGRAAGPEEAGRAYDMRLRTHPSGDQAVPTAFLALGDYGVGIHRGDDGRRQEGVARTLEYLAANRPVRFLVSLGDNIYHGPGGREDQSGDEDDDWYFPFFQPYRYLVDHLPLYPAAGNHDGADEEASDDRQQLADNFYLDHRFGERQERGRASLGPGLFYRLQFGSLLELLCVDTTWGEERGVHFFDDDRHRPWLERALPEQGEPVGGGQPVWRIPFCHHPAHCAGPHHEPMKEQITSLLPLYHRAGVRLLLSGHEHNFQHGRVDGLDYLVAGAAAKLQERPPFRFADGGTLSWSAEPHCLLVEVAADRLTVTAFGPTEPGA
ncbi:MAG: metallophosphoesterase, partial [Acidimicrobiales bacterium]